MRAQSAGQVSHSGSHAVYTAFIETRLDFWAGTGITPLAVVNNTINDGLKLHGEPCSARPRDTLVLREQGGDTVCFSQNCIFGVYRVILCLPSRTTFMQSCP